MNTIFYILFLISIAFSCSTAFLESLFGRPQVKDQCPIKLYDVKDSLFSGIKLYANSETFHPLLKNLSKYAMECKLKIKIKQSFVQENSALTNLKINDRTEMAFRLGEAIDFELVDQENKLLCNSMCLQKDLKQLKDLPQATCFLEKLRKDLSFRQDAIKPNILIKQPKLDDSLVVLEEKRKLIQKQCSKLKIDI